MPAMSLSFLEGRWLTDRCRSGRSGGAGRGLPTRIRKLLAIAALAALPPAPAFAQELPEGQSQADYAAWQARDPGARAAMLSFESYLGAAGAGGVVPSWQLVRTASSWKQCAAAPFEVAPPGEWPHVAATLKFVRDHVVPVIGPVEAVSAYRDDALNHCAGGAPESAHRHFYAVDFLPLVPIPRPGLMRSLCMIHDLRGRDSGIGLGFYAFTRFHLDSKGFRRWGADGKSATSPCNTGIFE
jgi:hypothetical protein